MKIIGVTVGTTVPKPNYEQTDPTKGDYIYGNILSAIRTDTTLTHIGHPADAKAVGDKFFELEQKINSSTSISDDGNGNITFEALSPSMQVQDDGSGNVIIC